MDEGLKGSDRALHPGKALALLRETLPREAGEVLRLHDVRVCKQRPGHRLVVRYEVDAGLGGEPVRRSIWYGKLYHGRGGERARRVLEYLRRLPCPGLRLPEPLGYHPRWRFLLTAEVPGRALSTLTQDPHLPQHLEHAAEAIAVLHTRSIEPCICASPDVVGLKQHDAAAETAVLDLAEQRILTSTLPDESAERFWTFRRAVLRSLSETPGLPGREQIIHRDLFPAQIVIGPGFVGLLDPDEVALGEPELDVGNFTAHLVLADLQETGTIGVAPFLCRTFLDAYQRVARLRPDRLRTYTASALLRLASWERLAQPGSSVLAWPELAEALMAETGRVLDPPEPAQPPRPRAS